jgi:hypothetical protein
VVEAVEVVLEVAVELVVYYQELPHLLQVLSIQLQ